MTGWIRLSCPVSLRTQIRHGSPFNWESLPAEDRFASTIDSRKAGSFRWAAPTRKMFLDLSALRESGGVADPRRPCEQESSFFRPVRKSQWRKPLLGLERTWDSLAGLGPEERRVRALPECRPAVCGPNTSKCGGSRRSDNRRERSVRGPLGGLRIGSRISRADRYARKGIFGGAADRHTGGRLECRASGLWVGLNAHGPRGWAAALG